MRFGRSSYCSRPDQHNGDPDLAILNAILDELRQRPFYG
jgi:hypothetical protein